MLYQPTNVIPSLTGALGNGVVDAYYDLTVRWQVNGSSKMTAFQVDIFRNNSNSTLLLSTGRLTDNCPFSGTNYKGEVQMFSYVISASALKNAGIVNGGEYKLTIKQWWGDTDFVLQTSASAFITRGTPSVIVNQFPVPLAERKYTFTANSYQSEGDTLNWVRWQTSIVSPNGDREIIDDTGRIYGTSDLQYTFDGFASGVFDGFSTGTEYAIKCTVQTENGVEAEAGWVPVWVSYTSQPISGTLQACGSRLGSGVKLMLPEMKNIPAKSYDKHSGPGVVYSISDSYIKIDPDGVVYWSREDEKQLNIEPNSESGNLSVAWRGKTASNGELLQVTGALLDGGADGKLYFDVRTSDISLQAIANLPFSTSLQLSLCVGNGIYLVGDTSGVFYTEDGTAWTQAAMPAKSDSASWKVCYGRLYGQDTYLAVGGTTIARSFDGKTWDLTGSTEAEIATISFANNKFFCTDDDGLHYSENGTNWNNAATEYTGASYGTVTYGNGVYVTICGRYASYSYDGITWSTVFAPKYSFANVCFGNGVFVAAECNTANGTKITYSYDGISWNLITLPTPRAMAGISYIGGTFVLAYKGGLATSYDGITWKDASNTSGSWTAIASSSSKIIVASNVDWSVKTSNEIEKKLYVSVTGSSEQFTQIANSGDLSVFSDGESVYVASDLGKYTWEYVTTNINYVKNLRIPALMFGDGRYVVPVGGNASSLYSDDGVTWKESEKYSSSVSNAMTHANTGIYANGAFYVFTYDESAQSQKGAILSGDGTNWNIQYAANSDDVNVYAVAYSEKEFVALTPQGAVYSLDSTSSTPAWEFKSNCPITAGQFMNILYLDGVYVVVSDASTNCAYTTDLVNWSTSAISSDAITIQDAKVLNGLFVVTGTYSSGDTSIKVFVSTSNNGRTWTAYPIQNPEVASKYARVAFANGEFVVCNESVMWHSKYLYDWERTALEPGATRYVTGGDTGFVSCRPGGTSSGFIMCFTTGARQITKFDVPVHWASVNDIQMEGYQECDYVVVGDTEALSSAKNRILCDMSYHPNDVKSKFYADFISSTNAGGVGNTGFTDFAIYRQTPGDSVLTHVFDISPEDGSTIIDTSAVTNTQYVYYAYGIGSVSSQAIQSNQVTMCLWDWAVISCTQDESGTYRPENIFLFGKNLSSGAIGNNNTPNILQNFTQYPTLQPTSWNYRSGTLSSLIGVISDGVYSDTVEMQKRIYALSTTSNELFLKDRKGNLIRIKISGQIEMSTMDGTPQQAQNVKIPWVETGSTDGIKIKLTKNDGAWPY